MKKLTKQPMKIYLYVTRSGQRGNVDVEINDELAVTLFREHLTDYATPFVSVGGGTAHRLVTSTSDALLAFRWLRTEIVAVQRWAALVVAQKHSVNAQTLPRLVTVVPDHVENLWNRYPVQVYRELLGVDVQEALAEVARRQIALDWNDSMRKVLQADDARDAFRAAKLAMPEDDPTATDPKRTWVPVARYCDPSLLAVARELWSADSRKA